MSINAQPFSPTFKLVGNLSDSQILVYDASENAFVNATNTGASGSTGLTSVLNTGTGEGLGQATGSALELKSLIAGTNLTITDNGTALVIDATSTTANITGTNLGTGSGVYKGTNTAGDQLEFKSIAVGNGLTLTDANDTLTLECTITTTGFLQATNNLSDLDNATTARTNLDVYSKSEADAKYFRVDQTTAPTVDNTFDLGTSTKRFNDIYAETLQGTAVLSDNLTITGNSGDVLTFNGTTWVASAPTGGGGGGGGASVPQTLTYANNVLSISGGNSVTITPYVDLDPYVRLDQSSIPTVDNQFDIGSSTYRYQDVYAETFQGTAVLSDNLTIAGNTGDVLTYNGSTWVASPPANAGGGGAGVPQTLTLNGSQIAISGGNNIDIGPLLNNDYNNLANKPTIPADVSDLTDTSNLLGGGSQTLSLSGTQLTISGQNTVDFAGMFTDTDNQTLSWNSSNNYLTISNGNYVDLSSLAGGGGATNITDLGDVDTSSAGHVPTDGQALLWSQAMGHWMPGDVFDGDYNSLSNQPTIPSNQTLLLSGTQLAITGGNTVDFAGMFTDTDNQTLSFDTSTNILTIANGNTVDLSTLAGGGGASAMADLSDVDSNDTVASGDLLLHDGSEYKFVNLEDEINDRINIRTPYLIGQATIDDLSDVSITGTSDGQFLVYNNTSGEWENQTVNISGSILGASDTTIANTQQYQTLQWNGTAWVNAYPSIQHLSDVDRLNNPSNGDTLVWNALNNQYEYSQAVVSDQSLATTDNVTFNNITSTGTIQSSGTIIGQAFEGKLYDTNGNVILDNTSGAVGFGGNISSNGPSSFSGTVDFNGATIQNFDLALGDLSNVSSTAPSTGYVLKWSGTEWAPAADSTATGGSGISLTDLSSGVGLSYNNVTGQFALNASISDLLDVNTSGIASGQILKWNGSAFVAGDDNVLQSTDNLPEGTSNLYWTQARFDASWNSKSTDDLPGGSTNLYYADALVDARVNTLLQAGPGINIIPSAIPGAPITIENTNAGSTYTDSDARNAISVSQGAASGSGSLSYNSSNGTFTFAPADLSSYSTFDGDYNSLTNKPNVLTLNALSATNIAASGGGSLAYDSVNGTFTFTPPDLSSYSTFDGDYNSLTNKPTLFDGQYSSLSGTPTIPSALGDLTMPSGTNGQVLTTDGSGNFTFTTVTGGGSSYGDADVSTYLNGGWDFNLVPDANSTYDIGDSSNKVRHIFLDDNLYIGNNTLNTSGSNLMFNSQDVMDYTNIKNKPTIPVDVSDLTDTGSLLGGTTYTAGTGLQLNTGVFSLDASIGDLDNVSATAPTTGQVLSWTGSEWAPAAAGGTPNLSSSSIGDLNDVNISGISAGQFLEWDGTRFVAASASAADLTSESITELQDVATDTPNNGDVLTWDSTTSAYKPSAPASGGGGSGGTSVERFKLNYSTSGQLSSISNTTSGVSATITSATGGDVEVTFSGHSYPPAGVLIYGYVRTTNEYSIMPLNKDIGTRKVAAGGSPGSPTAFGSLGSSKLTLTLREADTGASRSFGTDTHAWVVFTMS